VAIGISSSFEEDWSIPADEITHVTMIVNKKSGKLVGIYTSKAFEAKRYFFDSMPHLHVEKVELNEFSMRNIIGSYSVMNNTQDS
jgi:hypothetical protein